MEASAESTTEAMCAGNACFAQGQEQFVTTVVLISAVFASLAGGVLLAYALCTGMFHLLRMHSMQVAQQRADRRAAQALVSADLIAG